MTSGYINTTKTVIVYIAVNLMNGKRYVGITCSSLGERKRRHFCDARCGVKTKFANAIRKYGKAAFNFVILEHCLSYEMAQQREVALIAQMKPEYNSTAGGGGSAGFKHKPESIERMRLAKKGKPSPLKGRKFPHLSEPARQRRLAKPVRYWLGKKRDPETNLKISLAKKGKSFAVKSDRQKVAWRANRLLADEAKRIPVECVDDGLVFRSLTQAAKHYGVTKATICSMLKGRCATAAKGRVFRYVG